MRKKKKTIIFILYFILVFNCTIIANAKESKQFKSIFLLTDLSAIPTTSSAIEIEPTTTPEPAATSESTKLISNVKLENLNLDFTSKEKGFSPSPLNRLYFHFFVKGETPKKGTTYLTIKIYNKKKKMIYFYPEKEIIKNPQLLEYEWDGKPSNENESNTPSSKYVKPGNYYLEITAKTIYPKIKNAIGKNVENTENGSIYTLTKTQEFKLLKPGISYPYGNDKNLVPKVSASASTDYMADKILDKIIQKNMTNEEKIRAVYKWMIENNIHIHGYKEYYINPKYDKILLKEKALKLKGKNKKCIQNGEVGIIDTNPNSRVYHFLRYQRGNCYYWMDTFQYLLERLGFEAKSIEGAYINSTGTRPPHGFNTVQLNTSWYWYDTNIDYIINTKSNRQAMGNYMLTRSAFEKRHVIPYFQE